MHCRKRQGHFVHVGTDLVIARDDQGREVLLVDGRIAEGRGGHAGGGNAGNLGTALEGAGEVRHYWMCNKCTDRCWTAYSLRDKQKAKTAS